MTITVADVIKIMERLAPSHLAEKWDNVGLQVGRRDWPVKRIWVALDPAENVVASACQKKADLLITHHPLIFKPLKSLDFNTPAGDIIHKASQHQLAIFSAHTNLDSVSDGVNDVLASKIGLKNINVLQKIADSEVCKLVVYVPTEYEERILNALFETKAGKIGEYSCCSFRSGGKGTFKPEARAKPFIGEVSKISHADEVRVETVVPKGDLAGVIEHVRKNHPYQRMAYDIYPLLTSESRHGLGRVGEIDGETTLASFALKIKKELGLGMVKTAGPPNLLVRKAAVCSGSGSSLMNAFLSSEADVYITGDLRYHDARDAEVSGRGLIDVGHFASERIIVEVLAERLGNLLSESGSDVHVEACQLEKDPFLFV
jgi:dinuclear metal center YbgI/SA1388 family protein